MNTTRRRAVRVAACVAAASVVLTACAPDPPGAVVGIVVDSCDPGAEHGSGMIVAPGLVLTSAHVVAGAQGVTVRQRGREFNAAIVGFDPNMDLAYLRFEGPRVRPVGVDPRDAEADDVGVAYVVRDDQIVAEPVRIRRRVNINTEDIYVKGETLRPGFELDAMIQSGDSGGAVVVDGKVIGVIWARSNRFESRAYAIDPVRSGDLINEQLRSGRLGPDVDIARCH